MTFLLILLGFVSSGLAARPAMPPEPFPPLERARAEHLELDGIVRRYLDAVTNNWLLPAPEANPAMLAMFADRDRPPYRDLLPWSGEFAGKYLTGATQVLHTTGDPRLRRHLERFRRRAGRAPGCRRLPWPFSQGTPPDRHCAQRPGKPGATWDAWGHYHVMLGLLLWHEATEDPAALAAACRIGDLLCARFLGDKQPRLVDTGSTEMNLAPAHALCLLFRKTREKRYLDLAGQFVGEFAAVDPTGKPLAGDYFRRGLAGDDFYRLPKPRWESLHPVLCLAELSRITGEDEYGKAFANLWWSIARLDRHNNGGFSSGEQAQGNPYHRGAIETCCTIAWMAMTVEMLRLTGDSIAADELELSTLNSAMGLFSPTGRWSTYNTPMDGVRKANFHEIVFQSRPGSPELNCCSVNAARGLGLLSEWALMHDAKNDALVLNWYGPGQLSAQLASGTRVRLTTDSEYPRSGRVRIKVDLDRPGRFSLRLRIPHWSKHTTIQINDQPARNVNPGTYLRFDHETGSPATSSPWSSRWHFISGLASASARAEPRCIAARSCSLTTHDSTQICRTIRRPSMPATPSRASARSGVRSLPWFWSNLPQQADPSFSVISPARDSTVRLIGPGFEPFMPTPVEFSREHPWRSQPLRWGIRAIERLFRPGEELSGELSR